MKSGATVLSGSHTGSYKYRNIIMHYVFIFNIIGALLASTKY